MAPARAAGEIEDRLIFTRKGAMAEGRVRTPSTAATIIEVMITGCEIECMVLSPKG
jgi:hypothetical protein